MKYYTYKQSEEWDEYVKSFPNWDVYYLCEYAISLMLHGDGEPLLLCYEDEHARMCYVVMKNDIAHCPFFKNSLPNGKYFDFTTPYGYGGPLVAGDFSIDSQKRFAEHLNSFCEANDIVSQFIRFHPLFGNQINFSEVSENLYSRETIYIDTASEEVIFENLDSKNRNMIRKARKLGVQIINRPIEDFHVFYEIYHETMRWNNADYYYYFNEEYFTYLKDSLKDNATIFYAMSENKPVSGAVFLFNEKSMHYHLAGTYWENRNLAAGNLLLYEAAIWACKRGITRMHLGGGLSENDSLFAFKAQFNRNGRLPFYIGRTIFSSSAYDFLLKKREELDPGFNIHNSYMIKYRR